jgi:uridine phosphorylase
VSADPIHPIHLQPTAPLAERVLLPGDPGRALRLAQALLNEPKMFNHHRGLWGYTGTAADEQPLTIQSTGMGGPSAAIVITELAILGARRLIRVGTCGALDPNNEHGPRSHQPSRTRRKADQCNRKSRRHTPPPGAHSYH